MDDTTEPGHSSEHSFPTDDRVGSDLEMCVVKAVSQFEWSIGPEAFAAAVSAVADHSGATRWMEIGGGRSPLVSSDLVATSKVDFTISDIDQGELDLGPDYAKKLRLDIGDPAAQIDSEYDLVFSRYVMEHVKDTRVAYHNCARLLRPGGVAMHLIPTLFSPPFVINKVLPESVSGWVLNKLAARPLPKFPARYDGCAITERSLARIREAGFSEIHVVPVYWHNYFDRVPVVRTLSHGLDDLARRRGWRWLTSSAYVLAVK